jgi:DNA repair protein RadA/Sms
VQALVAPSALATPRRAVVGWDQNRLAMVLAVLETHAGVRIGANDVYLNVAGGLRVREPAADLAVAAALVSSLTARALPADTVLFGEISLSGALRPVSLSEQRVRESEKLGMKAVVTAAGAELQAVKGLKVRRLEDLAALVAWIAAIAA